MNWLRQNYRQIGADGLALLLMIIVLTALFTAALGLEMQP